MNAYFDLMAAGHIILSLISGIFLNVICVNRLLRRGLFKLAILTIPIIFLIYFKWWISLILIILIHLIIFITFFKKNFFSPFIAYLSCYYGNAFFMSLFTKNVLVKSFVFVICAPKGFLSLLLAPIFLLILYIVTKGVDSLYHLGNYKSDIILSVNNQKARFRSYFDTGNTLKYKGIPVIFCMKDAWPFDEFIIAGNVTFKTVDSSKTMPLAEALLTRKENEKTLVYVALVDNNKGFNGCECLLNAYLN